MAKKYLKNENGIVRAVTSENLQLEKPLLNENYDIEVHNRNMDKIDSAIQEVKGKVDGLELTAEKVTLADKSNLFNATNVEDALLENKRTIFEITENINDLKLSVSNGKELIANAITDKGIEATKNDSFQVLANKISNLSNIDVRVVEVLPSEVIDNQIIIISDIQPNNIYIDSVAPTSCIDNDVLINIIEEEKQRFEIKSNKISCNIKIFGALMYKDEGWVKVKSYIGVDGEWVGMNNITLYSESESETYKPNFTFYNSNSYSGATVSSNALHMLMSNAATSGSHAYIQHNELINMAGYTTLIVESKGNDNTCFINIESETGDIISQTVDNNNKRKVLKIDVSNINVKARVVFRAQAKGMISTGLRFYIYNVSIE